FGAVEDVLVGEQVLEQRPPPIVAGVERLSGQFPDRALELADVGGIADGLQNPVQSLHAVAAWSRRLITVLRPLAADIRLADQSDLGWIHAEEAGAEGPGRLIVV